MIYKTHNILVNFVSFELLQIVGSLLLLLALAKQLSHLVVLFLSILRVNLGSVASQSAARGKLLIAKIAQVEFLEFHCVQYGGLVIYLNNIIEQQILIVDLAFNGRGFI